MLKKSLCIALVAVLVLGVFAMLLAKPAESANITEMKVSEELVELLQEMEGFVAVPKWDYTQWTVGFGSACPEEDLERYQKEGITPEEAHQLMLDHLVKFEKDVNAFMVRNNVQLNQHQFDAMVSFVYNLGTAVLHNVESDVIKAVLNGAQDNAFMFAIGQWCSAGGEFMVGLLRRRMMEAYMYLYGTYSATLPNSFCYVQYDPNGGNHDTRAQGYDSNLVAVPMSVPTRSGYIFAGWYTEATGGVKVTALDESTNGMTLYAHWEVGTLTPDNPVESENGITVTVQSDYVAVRLKADNTSTVVSRLYLGEKIAITGTTLNKGMLWGCTRKGWVCLDYTDYFEVTGTERPGNQTEDEIVHVPVGVTVLTSSGVEVRNGPHTTYPKLGTLKCGETVLIEEVTTFCGQLWGRYVGGWIRLNQKVMIHDDQTLAHSVVITITYSSVNVRSGPGTQYSAVTQMKRDEQAEIFAVVIVDGIHWGRFASGWIHLDKYTDFDAAKFEYYQHHSYGQWYIVQDPTCSKEGQQRRDCQYCNHYELQAVEIISHNMGQWYVSVESICVVVGEERRDCQNCDYHELRSTDLGDHSYGQWYVTQEATCYQMGQQRRDCQNCDHHETEDILMTAHNLGKWTQTLAPGCETAGREEMKCKDCDHTRVREIPATGHSYGQWYQTVEPTADAEGESRRDCEHCDHYETKVLPANPHVYGQWFVYQEASCTEAGEERRQCEHCELFESRPIEIKEHSFGQWFADVEATCSAPGVEKRQCTGCELSETREIALLDHSFGQWFVSTEATCSAPGVETRQCAGCELSETKEIAQLEHDFGQWYLDTEATCVTVGVEKRQCTGCEHVETRQLALGEHSYGQWYTHVVAGCETAGEERRECAHCQNFESRPVEATGHTMGQWYVEQSATCTVEGQERSDCQHCDHYVIRSIHMVDHIYGTWHVVTVPTIDAEGLRYRECTVCGGVENGTLPALPSVERVYATITHSSVNVRQEPSTTSTAVGKVYAGLKIEILEQQIVDDILWGRTEFGWVYLTGYATLRTVREAVVTDIGEKIYATVTCNSLSVRTKADSSATRVAILNNGASVRIYEMVNVNGVTWGRTSFGWIWMTGYVSIETVPGEHVEHNFGEWYVSQEGTCTTHGQERRDCSACDYSETRQGALGEHSYGQWFVSKAATCAEMGQRQRNCQLCDHFETRYTELSNEHVFGDWYLTVLPGCETVGQQCRDCQLCEHYETKQADALGHSYGQWFVSKVASCVEAGQEQRNCQQCDHVETRETGLSADHVYGDWYLTVVPGCETVGEQCRDCQFCDHYETKQSDALGHKFGQWYVEKEPTESQYGQERRDCENCDHHELKQIDKLPSTAAKVYGVFTGTGYLNIREGAGTTYKAVGKLYPNIRVEILEQTEVEGKVWGRIEEGWVLVTGMMTLEIEDVQQPVTKTYGTVSNPAYTWLNVRSDAGYGYDAVSKIRYGTRVEIWELKTVDGKVWGRIEGGWILITDMVTLETVTE